MDEGQVSPSAQVMPPVRKEAVAQQIAQRTFLQFPFWRHRLEEVMPDADPDKTLQLVADAYARQLLTDPSPDPLGLRLGGAVYMTLVRDDKEEDEEKEKSEKRRKIE